MAGCAIVSYVTNGAELTLDSGPDTRVIALTDQGQVSTTTDDSAPDKAGTSRLQTVITTAQKAANDDADNNVDQTITAITSEGNDQITTLPLTRYTPGGRALVIPRSELDPKEYSRVNQDLLVMSKILEKAAGKTASEEDRTLSAMNIVIHSGIGAQPWRSLYLDGYGALFFLNVRMPLVGSEQPSTEEKKAATEDSVWEQTKREMYGQRDSQSLFWRLDREARRGEPQKYDEQKVENLKHSILEALKNATNLKNVKPEEWITVVVTSGEVPGTRRLAYIIQRTNGRPGNRSENVLTTASPEQSVLTIRVKKSDVDDFASGKLSYDDFRAKAHVLAYGVTDKATANE